MRHSSTTVLGKLQRQLDDAADALTGIHYQSPVFIEEVGNWASTEFLVWFTFTSPANGNPAKDCNRLVDAFPDAVEHNGETYTVAYTRQNLNIDGGYPHHRDVKLKATVSPQPPTIRTL